MGLFSFIKDAGEKLFGSAKPEEAAQQAQAAPDDADLQARAAEANRLAGEAIAQYIVTQGLAVENLAVAFDGGPCEATVSGNAPDQATKEKVLLCAGNVQGVKGVHDQMTVTEAVEESRWHDVVRGDTLSGIAKTYYGNANLYPKIFEANKPMLSHPDKIYVGQKLRIPPV
ncbi:MAG TPA: peptidoglycan-binding protein LysM [Burkholderiaceae bacterium]|nr:peptidoglycan-binding protein LysM [Burkholderiaceae bacterium]HMX09782.1 peptidoglycan-binding protein LysM [Burkholderiaceae bacterium]HMY98645.1 peptidoglycan-binding protein LysM [Burkholderiaceae bacterium]HNB43593.1 peptidoglycan-binding protein LysM [Burkholderiaceae bacterium]HNG78369.1 peptidoglycan-binding protein LysM [Burkholderiaceae bacterium]